jgi:hypothetical protein
MLASVAQRVSPLYAMIQKRQIQVVAAQDVDRFFRDITQIETNIFIEACRASNVMVLTPNMVYDFSHPTQGRYHIQMFRDQAERAADYLEHHVKGRLVQSRTWLLERGMWAGRIIPIGYMVDLRKHLPDGTPNPHYKKYVPFEPYASIVRSYYEIFREQDGSATRAWEYVQKHGPYYPEFDGSLVPSGFRFYSRLDHREAISGRLMPAPYTWGHLLGNVAYIGHWVHRGVIEQWHNHPALVDEGLFMFAYNRLFQTDFFGEPNPDYRPYRAFQRVPKETRTAIRATYAGLVFSDDVPNKPHQRVSVFYHSGQKVYKYHLVVSHSNRSTVWNVNAKIIDDAVDEQLLARLKATVIDERLWQEALKNAHKGEAFDRQAIQQEIKQLRQEQDNIIVTLRLITNEEMVKRAQAQYEIAGHRIETLKKELEDHQVNTRQEKALLMVRPSLEKIAQHWDQVSAQDKRQIFEDFAQFMKIHRVSSDQKVLSIYWRDGEITEVNILRADRGFFWDPEMLELLKEMVERPAPQKEILQTFPQLRWRTLMERYAYHFGSNGTIYKGLYKGILEYTSKTRWIDTEEYKQQSYDTQVTSVQPSVHSLPIS